MRQNPKTLTKILCLFLFFHSPPSNAFTVTNRPIDDQLLQAVSYTNNEARVEDLLNKGADPDAQLLWNTSYGQIGESIWLVALGKSSPGIIALLKTRRTSSQPIAPRYQVMAFERVIHTSQAGNPDYARQRIQVLIDNGLDINAIDKEDLSNKAHTADSSLSPLMMAAMADRLDLVNFLLSRKADPKARTRSGENVLFFVRSPEMARVLLDAGADAGDEGKYGRTPLQAAIFDGRADVVSALLDKGGDLQRQKTDEALVLACRILIQTTAPKAAQNSAPIIKMILEHGINPNLKIEHQGWTETPLMEAVRANNTAGLKLLLEAGADPLKVKYGHGTLLEQAVQKKDPEITRLLLPRYLPLSGTDRENLIKAFLQNGNPRVLPVLDQYGININETKKADTDAAVIGLINSVIQDKLDMVQALLDKGVEINGTGYNQTPLTAAVQYNNEKMAEFLISKGADVNKADKTGLTPLAAAVGQANFEMYQYLKSKKAVPVSKDPSHPYLLLAVYNLTFDPVYNVNNGSLEIMRDLLAEGNPADQTDTSGITPLWAMAGERARDSVGEKRLSDASKLLLDRHATVDWLPEKCQSTLSVPQNAVAGQSREAQGTANEVSIPDPREQMDYLCRTPLSNAAAAGNSVMARVLISAGADINRQSPSDGETPLMHAAYYGDPRLVSWLLEHGADVRLRDKKNQTAADIARMRNNTKAYVLLKAADKTGASL